ncbi:unnamed protein product [Amoebophrya sp. A25]|nr:unnamed protein product [Amoebophrya sp. A25]|eukprot:GSA25T00005441001.1
MMDRFNDFVERNSRGWIQIPRSQEEEQCWDCRIVGTVALYTTSALSWRCFFTTRRNDLGNRIFFGAMGLCFLGLGTYRAITPTKHVDHVASPRRFRHAWEQLGTQGREEKDAASKKEDKE